ncbi:hypothetical protein LXL04_010568 [Taraxacum kok-saghyz]
MAKTRGMTRRQNNRKRLKTFDNGGGTSWSDLDHDVLSIVMMQLGYVDFLSFSEVCKSWRSLALSNKKKFMASRPPMWISYSENECYLKDLEGRKFKTPFPHFAHRRCVGITCGYLILFGGKTYDFWLVNPITRHELYFPRVPHIDASFVEERARAVLVFSPSISAWVFLLTYRLSDQIWFSVTGKGTWNHVSSTFPILDLHFFKGKIYSLNKNWQLCEMSLTPEPKLTLLEIKVCLRPEFFYPKFVSEGENLYVIDQLPGVQKLDFGKMKWVLPDENIIGEYGFFLSVSWKGMSVTGGSIVKLDPWARSQYKRCDHFTDSRKGRFFVTKNLWYFPHECMHVNLIDE